MTATGENTAKPELWRTTAPEHFDLRLAWWLKVGVMALLVAAALRWWDLPVAQWALQTRPIPDMANPAAKHGDIARDLMFLEQFGQWTCTILALVAVLLLDRAGRRRALAIGMACLFTVLLTYLLKDLCGRNRPYVVLPKYDIALPLGAWVWGGPQRGFAGGSTWGSFPSAHTTGAFALAAGLSWFYPRGRGLFMALASITAAQRVLHGAHYLSDVLAGLAIGVGVTRSTLAANLPGQFIARLPEAARRWVMDKTLNAER